MKVLALAVISNNSRKYLQYSISIIIISTTIIRLGTIIPILIFNNILLLIILCNNKFIKK